MSAETPNENERYCRECGEIILAKAEICPECGVRQQGTQNMQQQSRVNQGTSPTANGGAQHAANRGTQQVPSESYGLIFAIVDTWKYYKPLRHLLNAVMAFSTVGAYLAILLFEALIHYRNLNNGDSVPYDENKKKVWTTFTDVQ